MFFQDITKLPRHAIISTSGRFADIIEY